MNTRGSLKLFLLTVLVSLSAVAAPIPPPVGTVYFEWDALPAEASEQVAEIRIYYGLESGQYTHYTSVPANTTTYAVPYLPLGHVWYFAATTRSAAGAESIFSDEVTVDFTQPVAMPPVMNFHSTYQSRFK